MSISLQVSNRNRWRRRDGDKEGEKRWERKRQRRTGAGPKRRVLSVRSTPDFSARCLVSYCDVAFAADGLDGLWQTLIVLGLQAGGTLPSLGVCIPRRADEHALVLSILSVASAQNRGKDGAGFCSARPPMYRLAQKGKGTCTWQQMPPPAAPAVALPHQPFEMLSNWQHRLSVL